MSEAMPYPVRDPVEWAAVDAPSGASRLRLALVNLRRRVLGARNGGVTLAKIGGPARPPRADEVILVCVVRNAGKQLPSLLAHYRALGVRRFAFVDDRSDDDTRLVLAAADDADVFESNVGFQDSRAGRLWRDMLCDIYGRDRWYVSIDSDEYLIFPGCETRPLPAFIADLERRGFKRAMAAMIDIYPDGAMGEAPRHEPPEAFPTRFAPLFDAAGYSRRAEQHGTAIRGGPRFRKFGSNMRLTKFPVIFVDGATQFSGGSHHAPLPLSRNFSAVHAVLLHYKFLAGALDDLRALAERGAHSRGAKFYRDMVAHADFGEDLDFRWESSARFAGSEDMARRGFMQDLR